jgi:gas vesicle protein
VVTPNEAISTVQNFISLAEKLKSYITPQYKPAASALCKIVDNFLLVNQSLLKWVTTFEIMDLREETKIEFLQFYKDFEIFVTGPEYHKMKRLYDQVASIYQTMLKSPIRRWFSRDKEKLENVQNIFYNMYGEGSLVANFVYDILKQLEDAIHNIKERYENAKKIQETFLENVKEARKTIREQANRLSDLLRDYMRLSGAIEV